MEEGKPSRTAWAAAAHRAAHQVLEQGRIFSDPLAIRILGDGAQEAIRQAEQRPEQRAMRIFIAVRTRFAEDALAAAVERGVSQLVILGAGLDTYAYRSRFQERLVIFEVDHPTTQAWKRQRLQQASIAIPAWLTFAPIDVERQTLAAGLADAGFDSSRPTFFLWLGVVPYLSAAAVWTTFTFIAGLAHGAHVIFDYSDPPASLPEETRIRHERRAAHVADLGEAWKTYFEPEELRHSLSALGFRHVEDLGPRQIAARYFPSRLSSVSDRGGHIVHAATAGVSVG